MHSIFLITLVQVSTTTFLFLSSCQCDLHLGCLDFISMDMQVCSHIAAIKEYFGAPIPDWSWHLSIFSPWLGQYS
ncbi:1-(5-phosphoribosyl)-5-[(5-phosphoribosylamino)methylideneamino] imidazole-4-carboxamide isomerase chloroplastic [Zea mays]|uniref:1-(5-phosphoribosyl)-5-[(5-phosphoribosylamino)methylideneamino] imidazole-4-carboxamide isomerase chloroplastic n=1 Tax=Zea mays TaxID=4577 RepID=A0A1D6M3T6_MAIZE|nr:1-(5-phosphoribosyl)-5-[(5-phosphoribosylamino)methylideneamino] imidazole-4-carboxamide isomerase chloroplastic [Zea mays]